MYDAIVVGARCAGSPTALLLARQGYRVLLVDKATFPSDAPRNHSIHPPGIARLRRWFLFCWRRHLEFSPIIARCRFTGRRRRDYEISDSN